MRRNLFYVFLISLIIITDIEAQNDGFFQYSTCLKEVSFSGETDNNYITILEDAKSDSPFLAPQYSLYLFDGCEKTGCDGPLLAFPEKQYPVGYVSGTKPKVSAKILSNCEKGIYIKGIGPSIDGGIIEFEQKFVVPTNGYYLYPETYSNIAFTDKKVKYWENFEIKWVLSNDEITWHDIGSSFNQMYVTYDQPILSSAPEPNHTDFTYVYHTVIHVGCKFANDKTNEIIIVEEIYNNEFTDQNVFKADNSGPMFYWGNINPLIDNRVCRSVGGLLTFLDAACHLLEGKSVCLNPSRWVTDFFRRCLS